MGCLPPGEKVLTDEGLLSIENVDVRNKLVDENGNYCDIINKQIYDVVDEDIYEIRDSEDFDGEEIKTITYYGHGEPELKIKVTEFDSKKPKKYILARTNKEKILKALTANAENSIEIELLGVISRDDFDTNKIKKRYGFNNPLNYIVGRSKMNEV